MPAEFFAPIHNGGTPPVYKYFNGKDWVDSKSGKSTDIKSPIDGSVVGTVPVVTHEEIDQVLQNAVTAQVAWEKTPLYQRVKIVHLAADWVRQYQDYLIPLMVREIGKTAAEAKGEIVRTAELIDYFADEVQSLKGETLDSDNFPGFDKGRIALIERVAYGVVVAIAPFNYPVNLSASKIAPALLMGNSVVYKPPTMGGISGLHLVRIFEKAGVPAGVLSAVTGGGGEIGDYLVSRPQVSMVAFTGNSDTGRHIASQAPMLPLLFECGGNDPAIVLPDADLKLAAAEIVKGGFSVAGQRCTGIKYVLATSGTMEALIQAVLDKMKDQVQMGDPRSPHTKMVGPIITEDEAKKIEAAINEAVSQGAQLICGGKRNGTYIEPTLLKNVKPEWNIVRNEVFGPVISFIAVDSTEEMVRIVNSSRFGLQSCVFTKDEGTGLIVAAQINTGTVQINGSPQRGPDHFPFLGVKHSGVGVQGVRYSLEAMSRLKPIVINKPQ